MSANEATYFGFNTRNRQLESPDRVPVQAILGKGFFNYEVKWKSEEKEMTKLWYLFDARFLIVIIEGVHGKNRVSERC